MPPTGLVRHTYWSNDYTSPPLAQQGTAQESSLARRKALQGVKRQTASPIRSSLDFIHQKTNRLWRTPARQAAYKRYERPALHSTH